MIRRASLFVFSTLFLVACGGSTPPPKVDEAPKEDGPKQNNGNVPVVQQELGSIDQRAVEQTFARLESKLESCHNQGRDRVEYLAGDVKVFLRVDQQGKVRYGYFEETTLGDRDTEKCIMDAFSGASWPKPIGGEAEIRNGFGWGPGGERQPTPWGPEKVIGALDESKDVKKSVAKCKHGVSGDFRVTAYVEAADEASLGGASSARKAKGPKPGKKASKESSGGGRFKALGVAAPGKEGAEKVDCIVDALRGLELPSPGSYAAKVTFAL